MGATRKDTKQGMGVVNGRGTMPIRPRKSNIPPAVICPSPLPPRITRSDAAELRRQMSTAPPPGEDGPKSTPRSRRPSIREDDVGFVGASLSAKQIPRLVKGKKDLSSAPIDSKDAFVLSQIDGTLSVDDLSDLTALPREEILSILERMVRLGLVLF